MNITEEKFAKNVGRAPENDDLERCNCECAGELGHTSCGWNTETDMPAFMGSFAKPVFKEE